MLYNKSITEKVREGSKFIYNNNGQSIQNREDIPLHYTILYYTGHIIKSFILPAYFSCLRFGKLCKLYEFIVESLS